MKPRTECFGTEVPFKRPDWQRVIERTGPVVLIRTLDEKSFERTRTSIVRRWVPAVLEAIAHARRHEFYSCNLCCQDGSHISVLSHEEGYLSFKRFDEEGTARSSTASVQNIDALERALRSIVVETENSK